MPWSREFEVRFMFLRSFVFCFCGVLFYQIVLLFAVLSELSM